MRSAKVEKQKMEAGQKIITCLEALQLIKTQSLPLKRTISKNYQHQGVNNDAISSRTLLFGIGKI